MQTVYGARKSSSRWRPLSYHLQPCISRDMTTTRIMCNRGVLSQLFLLLLDALQIALRLLAELAIW